MSKGILSFFVLVGFTALMGQSPVALAKGAPQNYAAYVTKNLPFDEEAYKFAPVDEEELAKQMRASETKRRPANKNMLDESVLTPELTAMEKELHALKTPEEVQAFLNKIDKNYDSYNTEIKFYVTQILPYRAFRGLFYRLRSLFENNSRFVHSQVLTFAKSLSTRTKVFVPYDHSKAMFDYLASAYYEKGALAPTFQNEADVQTWMVKSLLPELLKSAERLEKLNLTTPIVWDQKVIFGENSFKDSINRFKYIGEFERNVVLSSIYGALSSLAVIRSYNLGMAIELSKQVGFLYGYDGFGLFSHVEGVSMEDIAGVVRKKKFKTVGTLLPDGKDWMNYALSATRRSLQHLKIAFELSKEDRNDGNQYVVNTGFFNVNREEIEENLNLVSRVVFSNTTESLRSAVTGEVIQVNYSSLFKNPPSDWKQFLPTSFEQNKTVTRTLKTESGEQKTVTYRNYSHGSPNGWDIKKMEVYFPSIKTSDDVYKTVRVLSHAGGNWLGIQ